MKYTLTKSKSAHYQIVSTTPAQELEAMKTNVINHYAKDISLPGFRKGHVPLHIVKEQVQPQYLHIGLIEEVVNWVLKKLINENPDVKFIGQPYDLNEKEADGGLEVSFSLDVYPEIEESDKKREKLTLKKIETLVTEQDIDQALDVLKRQYAEYKNVDEITEWTITKVRFATFDVDGGLLDKGSAFIGKEDFAEFTGIKKQFLGQKMSDKGELSYDEKKLPAQFHSKVKDKKAGKISYEIVSIQEQILPKFDDTETLMKFFWNADIKTEKDLREKITEVLKTQKYEDELAKNVEDLVKDAKNSLSVSIPRTLIDEEFKSRMQNMAQRMWGEQGMKAYLEKIWEEETKKMVEDMKASAQESLQKFFVFKHILESHKIDHIHWDKPLDAEKKLYEKLVWGADTTAETEKKPAKAPKKTVAKKAE